MNEVRGYLPNPPDARDDLFSFPRFRALKTRDLGADSTAQESVFFQSGKRLTYRRPVRYQVGGSCVANAWCAAIEILADNATGPGEEPIPTLSAQGLYWCARQRHGSQNFDLGTHPRSAADALVKLGVGPESLCPNDPASINQRPANNWFTAAFDMRLRLEAYYNIQSTGEQREADVIFAINEGHPVVIGIPVDRPFLNFYGKEPGLPLTPPSIPSSIVGWHAVVIIGYEFFQDGSGAMFRILNSWGAWGENGEAWITSDYLAKAVDLHVPTMALFEP